MSTAGQGENKGAEQEDWAAEEKAAHILAFGLGYGSCWTLHYTFGNGTAWQPGVLGDESTPAAVEWLHIARETETLELASRAIHPNPKKQPDWVRNLPPAERAQALAWNQKHPLTGGANRVREFEHWKTTAFKVCVPVAPSGADVAAALAMAKLGGPLKPLLLLYALQDETQTETVLRYACAGGARLEIARDALTRLLCAARLTRGQIKPSVRMRRSDYQRQLREIECRMERWLHRAATVFLRAYGASVPQRPGAASSPEEGVIDRDQRTALRSSPRRLAA